MAKEKVIDFAKLVKYRKYYLHRLQFEYHLVRIGLFSFKNEIVNYTYDYSSITSFRFPSFCFEDNWVEMCYLVLGNICGVEAEKK